MTKPAHDANPRWLGCLLAALVAALITLFGAGTASTATAAAVQTGVGAHTLVAQVAVGPGSGISAGQLQDQPSQTYDSVLATGGAAENPVAAALRLASEGNYDGAAPSYDASVLIVDARTVVQVEAVGRQATVVPLRRHVGTASEGSVAVSGFGVAAKSVVTTPRVASTKLQNIVGDLYRGTTNPGRVGTGTTADAVRFELRTGEQVFGKSHVQKANDSLRGLENWLKSNPNAPYRDRLVARSLADDLLNALGRG